MKELLKDIWDWYKQRHERAMAKSLKCIQDLFDERDKELISLEKEGKAKKCTCCKELKEMTYLDFPLHEADEPRLWPPSYVLRGRCNFCITGGITSFVEYEECMARLDEIKRNSYPTPDEIKEAKKFVRNDKIYMRIMWICITLFFIVTYILLKR